MTQISQKNLSLILIGAFSVLMLDQVIKYKIRSNGGFYICNQGISFGLQLSSTFFWLITAILLFLLIYWLKQLSPFFLQNKPFFILLGVLIGGIVSNLTDRLFFGCVFDYIFPFWQKLPAFNIADVTISLSLLTLLFLYYLAKSSEIESTLSNFRASDDNKEV